MIERLGEKIQGLGEKIEGLHEKIEILVSVVQELGSNIREIGTKVHALDPMFYQSLDIDSIPRESLYTTPNIPWIPAHNPIWPCVPQTSYNPPLESHDSVWTSIGMENIVTNPPFLPLLSPLDPETAEAGFL